MQAQLLKGDVIMALVECTKPSAGGTDPLLLQVGGEGERWGGGHRGSSFIHLCGCVCSPPQELLPPSSIPSWRGGASLIPAPTSLPPYLPPPGCM